jgi:3-methylcrotonyl-CoA carboxylase alpha subunit
MKMEHRLRAPRDGVIATISCAQGNAVDEGQVLVELVKENADD